MTGTISTDGNGDGVNDLVVGVTRDTNNQLVETSTAFSANGVMLSRSVKSTSVDGLSVTTQVDRFGTGSFDATTTDVTVTSPGFRPVPQQTPPWLIGGVHVV